MKPHVLLIGDGVLADDVSRLLTDNQVAVVIRTPTVTSETIGDVALAVVVDDAWTPSTHLLAEEVFRSQGIPWMRAFVAFGHGIVGPLVQSTIRGCSQCADLRLFMTEAERNEVFRLRMSFMTLGSAVHDAWAGQTGLWHVALLVAGEIERILTDMSQCGTRDHVLRINLQTLDTARHFILPNSQCPVCGSLPDDSPALAVIPFQSVPKVTETSFRTTSLQNVATTLAHDYLDSRAGLMNGRVHDLMTPYAAVSVNLPLMMGDEGTSGRSHSYEACEPIAILEGLERYCGLEPRGIRPVIHASYASVKAQALNPVTVGLHATEEYASPDFPFQAFTEDVETDWVWGYSLTKQRSMLVPLRLAYYSLGWGDGFVYETSNGCALGNNLMEAVFHGILEVVERDAFLMTWYAKLPLPRIDVSSSKDVELQWMIERLRTVVGYDLYIYNATMENGIPSVFVIAKNRRKYGLNLLCSAGAHFDPMRAIKGAIQEAAGMLLRFDDKLLANREQYLEMLADATNVRQMEDHSMLYGLPEAEERLAFLLEGKTPVQSLQQAFSWRVKHLDLAHDVRHLVDIFGRLGQEVIVVNQTAPEIARNDLHCVKVLIPGMLPMTFGHRFRRLNHLQRVLEVPKTLGYTDRRLTAHDLNPYPHPFP